MKILIDARLYGLENAGLGRYVLNLVGELSKIDNNNEYVILLRKKYFETLNLPKNWKKVLVDFRHYSFSEQIKLPGIINKEKPDITHFPHFNVPVFFNGKYVVTIHDMLMHKSVGKEATTLPMPIYLIKRMGYRFVFDRAVKGANLVIVPTNAVLDEITDKYRINQSKIRVTYEGVDARISKGDSPMPYKPYFVYTGNAYPHKNLNNLIKAIKIVNTKYKQKVFLAIASARNIFTQRIENLIQKLSVKDSVKMLGFVPDEKLGTLFNNSVGFVFPSFSEGFGLPGLEALSSGTVLLASDIPVFREVYKDNALYFDPKNPESIALMMKNVLEMDEKTRLKTIQISREFVKNYSWVKMAQETKNIYEEALLPKKT